MWSITIAWVITCLSLYTFIQITAIFRSLKKLPLVLDENYLHLQFGIYSETSIQIHMIESIELISGKIKSEDNFEHLSPFYDFVKPNILIKLKEENTLTKIYGFKKKYKALVLYVDDETSFIDQINLLK